MNEPMTEKQKRVSLQSEVRRLMKSEGISYDAAFQTATTLKPELVSASTPPELRLSAERRATRTGTSLANTNDGDRSPAAGQRFRDFQAKVQEIIDRMKLDPITGYPLAFGIACRENPEMVGAMHHPNISGAIDSWHKNSPQIKTPALQAGYDRSKRSSGPMADSLPPGLAHGGGRRM